MDSNETTSRREQIYELQTMLRAIAQVRRRFPILNPDGIYGTETAEVVRLFQAQNSLPVTGEVNFETWQKILLEYRAAERVNAPGIGISPFPGAGYIAEEGDRSDLVRIIQILLAAISVAYDEFENLPPDGLYGAETARAVRRFQAINRLPETGKVDKDTWDEIAKSYNLFAGNELYTN